MSDSNESIPSHPEKAIAKPHQSLFDYMPNYDKPWYRVPHLLKLNLTLIVIMVSSTTSGYDSSMLNGLQSVAKWSNDMGKPQGAVLGAMSNGKFIFFKFKYYMNSLLTSILRYEFWIFHHLLVCSLVIRYIW